MNNALLDMWASSPRQTAHLTSALAGRSRDRVRAAGESARRPPRSWAAPTRHRTVTALLLAVLVLSVGLGGTAAAVSLVTGKQIKDGSVRGRDIGNGSLTGATSPTSR